MKLNFPARVVQGWGQVQSRSGLYLFLADFRGARQVPNFRQNSLCRPFAPFERTISMSRWTEVRFQIAADNELGNQR